MQRGWGCGVGWPPPGPGLNGLTRTTAFPTKSLRWRKQFFRLLCQIRSPPGGKALIAAPPPHLHPPLLVLRTGLNVLFMEMHQKVPWARGQETWAQVGGGWRVGGGLFSRFLRGVHSSLPHVTATLPGTHILEPGFSLRLPHLPHFCSPYSPDFAIGINACSHENEPIWSHSTLDKLHPGT